jgi:hypothetical protein
MQGQQPTHSAGTRKAQSKAQLGCYECNKLGHYARECYKRISKNETHRKNSPLRTDHQEAQNAKYSNPVVPIKSLLPSRKTRKRINRYHVVALAMDHGTSIVQVRIHGVQRILIVDCGSCCSVLQPTIPWDVLIVQHMV